MSEPKEEWPDVMGIGPKPVKLRIGDLPSLWRARIEAARSDEMLARSRGMEKMAKWYEGQADALERCESELERAMPKPIIGGLAK